MLIARGVTETEVVPRVARKTGWKHRRHATYGLRLFFRIVVKLATSRSNGTQSHAEGCNEIKK